MAGEERRSRTGRATSRSSCAETKGAGSGMQGRGHACTGSPLCEGVSEGG